MALCPLLGDDELVLHGEVKHEERERLNTRHFTVPELLQEDVLQTTDGRALGVVHVDGESWAYTCSAAWCGVVDPVVDRERVPTCGMGTI